MGWFIVLEGGEGTGKTTQIQRLAAALRDEGRKVVTTREPGGSPRAEEIRNLVLSDALQGVDARAELLLFAAARADHVAETIAPALAAGSVVLCDRFSDSSVAYQGVARGLGAEHIRSISGWAAAGTAPDLTIVLDIDPQTGLARADDHNRLEGEALEFHENVRQAFLDLAAADPGGHVVVEAQFSPDEVYAEIRRVVDGVLGGNGAAT